MSKMKELATVLDELVTCGETLISTANSLREIFSTEAPASDDAAKATEQPSAEKRPSGTPPAAKGRKKSASKEEATESGGLTDAAYQEESNKPEKPITKLFKDYFLVEQTLYNTHSRTFVGFLHIPYNRKVRFFDSNIGHSLTEACNLAK